MNTAGRFRPVTPGQIPVAQILQQGLDLVEDLSTKLQTLDALMLTGKPNEISDAAAMIELALNNASPAFAEIASAMGQLGACNLAAAAAQLRQIEQEDAGPGGGAALCAGALRQTLGECEPAGAAAQPGD